MTEVTEESIDLIRWEGTTLNNLLQQVRLIKSELEMFGNRIQRETEKRKDLETRVRVLEQRIPTITNGWEHPFWAE